MKTIIISSEQNKTFCKSFIDEMLVDGSQTVIFKKTDKSPTAKQNSLMWLWYSEVASSGIGGNDTKEGVHLTAKWQFARPIFLRDFDTFIIIFEHFEKTIEWADNKKALYREFTEQYISTTKLSKHQKAEYLTDFQRYWIGKGVTLTDPSRRGLDPDKLF
jgi:hypothetical protein